MIMTTNGLLLLIAIVVLSVNAMYLDDHQSGHNEDDRQEERIFHTIFNGIHTALKATTKAVKSVAHHFGYPIHSSSEEKHSHGTGSEHVPHWEHGSEYGSEDEEPHSPSYTQRHPHAEKIGLHLSPPHSNRHQGSWGPRGAHTASDHGSLEDTVQFNEPSHGRHYETSPHRSPVSADHRNEGYEGHELSETQHPRQHLHEHDIEQDRLTSAGERESQDESRYSTAPEYQSNHAHHGEIQSKNDANNHLRNHLQRLVQEGRLNPHPESGLHKALKVGGHEHLHLA